ncbi:hypothetical protein AB0M46_26980 [Dactylosporangium sp. NPDC051485]|uniref:hypothetical protein n=1 Tax=Dactylosporangium sp. NPDC051485 TaxID=3154846 RepID=UPI003437282F
MVTEAAVPTAPELRRRLVAELTAEGAITTDAVAHAMLAVPRELFAPAGTDLADVYAGHGIVITKRQPDGRATSSVSAPWLSLSTLIVLRSLRSGGRVPLISESIIATGGELSHSPYILRSLARGGAAAGPGVSWAVSADRFRCINRCARRTEAAAAGALLPPETIGPR